MPKSLEFRRVLFRSRAWPAGDRAEQRPMTDQVGIPPDRRGEMAVVRRGEPRVAEIAIVVVGLLERAQHERGQGTAPVSMLSHPVRHQTRCLAGQLAGLLDRKSVV